MATFDSLFSSLLICDSDNGSVLCMYMTADVCAVLCSVQCDMCFLFYVQQPV